MQERELAKLKSWTAALTQALRERGIPGPTAALTAAVAMAVFDVAAERWLARARPQPKLVDVLAAARAELLTLT